MVDSRVRQVTPEYQLRLTSAQHAQLRAHLSPGDELEAVALILCGRRVGDQVHALTAREIINIPHHECDRQNNRVTWPTTAAELALMRNHGRHQALIKVHSHPSSSETFSSTDTASDRKLLAEFGSFQDDALPHASCVMLPDGSMFGRVLVDDGTFRPLSLISVVGDDLLFWPARRRGLPPAFAVRQAQAFGDATIDLVRSLSVAVVGCS